MKTALPFPNPSPVPADGNVIRGVATAVLVLLGVVPVAVGGTDVAVTVGGTDVGVADRTIMTTGGTYGVDVGGTGVAVDGTEVDVALGGHVGVATR